MAQAPAAELLTQAPAAELLTDALKDALKDAETGHLLDADAGVAPGDIDDSYYTMLWDYLIGSGLLSVAMFFPAIAEVYTAATYWGAGEPVVGAEPGVLTECYKPLKVWLLVDGIIMLLVALPGAYTVFCGGKAHSANSCFRFPSEVWLIVGIVLYFQNQADSTLTTTTTANPLSTPGLSPCETVWTYTGLILIAKVAAPIAAWNYISCIVGGAGMITGLLCIPAPYAVCQAALNFYTDCERPLMWWNLCFGIFFSILPGFYLIANGIGKDVAQYAFLKQKAKEEHGFFAEEAAKEESLSSCAVFVNTCLCLPTLIFFVVGAVFIFQGSVSTCSSSLHWWTGVVLILQVLSPILVCCYGECCSTAVIPGTLWTWTKMKNPAAAAASDAAHDAAQGS